MKKHLLMILLLAACSNQHLDSAEMTATTLPGNTLVDLSKKAAKLSTNYSKAAQNTQSTQDVFAFLVVTSAASAISGIATEAPGSEIAAAAIAGTAAQKGGSRLAPAAAIGAIFDGAERMNCISAISALGVSMLPDSADSEAGVIATNWAIEHVRILTREKLTRNSVTFTEVFAEYKGSLDAVAAAAPGAAPRNDRARFATSAAQGIRAARTKPEQAFTDYLELLDKCTNTTPLPITTPAPAKQS